MTPAVGRAAHPAAAPPAAAVLAAVAVHATAVLLLVTGPAAAAPRPSCDPLDRAACLLPWPNDLFTRADASSPTGRRLALAPAATR